MAADIELREVTSPRDLEEFVRFPWQVYEGDRNWVPPLISEQASYLTPERNPLLRDANLALYTARRGRRVVGTVGAVLHGGSAGDSDQTVGVFGFFEALDDYPAAERLLDAARAHLRASGADVMRGPYNFSEQERPGVLIAGADCPPVMLAGHTPPYYKTYLERYGMAKFHDVYAWRAFRWQIGEDLEKMPEQIRRVAEAARRHGVTVRKARLDRWLEEVATAHHLFNATLTHLPTFNSISWPEFRSLAEPMRQIVDPDLALFAELEGRVVGFCVSLPDLNRALIRLNGRLFPLGWLRLWWYLRKVDVLTFKLMGVLPELRYRGIDALLFEESIRGMIAKGYQWLDGSLTSEHNKTVNLLASRFGAERYKHYRIYQVAV